MDKDHPIHLADADSDEEHGGCTYPPDIDLDVVFVSPTPLFSFSFYKFLIT